MTWVKPRPEGYDYNTPDPVDERCPTCNPDGTNRTGKVPVARVGNTTTCGWVKWCPQGCAKGLRVVRYEEGRGR